MFRKQIQGSPSINTKAGQTKRFTAKIRNLWISTGDCGKEALVGCVFLGKNIGVDIFLVSSCI
jgi:hypothetical protein